MCVDTERNSCEPEDMYLIYNNNGKSYTIILSNELKAQGRLMFLTFLRDLFGFLLAQARWSLLLPNFEMSAKRTEKIFFSILRRVAPSHSKRATQGTKQLNKIPRMRRCRSTSFK